MRSILITICLVLVSTAALPQGTRGNPQGGILGLVSDPAAHLAANAPIEPRAATSDLRTLHQCEHSGQFCSTPCSSDRRQARSLRYNSSTRKALPAPTGRRRSEPALRPSPEWPHAPRRWSARPIPGGGSP